MPCRINVFLGRNRERAPRENPHKGDFVGFSHGDLSPRTAKIRQTVTKNATHGMSRTFVFRGDRAPCENTKKSPFGAFSRDAFSSFRPENTIIRHDTNQTPYRTVFFVISPDRNTTTTSLIRHWGSLSTTYVNSYGTGARYRLPAFTHTTQGLVIDYLHSLIRHMGSLSTKWVHSYGTGLLIDYLKHDHHFTHKALGLVIDYLRSLIRHRGSLSTTCIHSYGKGAGYRLPAFTHTAQGLVIDYLHSLIRHRGSFSTTYIHSCGTGARYRLPTFTHTAQGLVIDYLRSLIRHKGSFSTICIYSYGTGARYRLPAFTHMAQGLVIDYLHSLMWHRGSLSTTCIHSCGTGARY